MTMTRDIYIGDIHGCLHELQQLMAEVRLTDADRLISVGDLVDRGPDSVALWELFRDRPRSIVLMGNHERKHVRGVLSYSQEIVRLQFGARYEAFRTWATALPYFLESPHAIAVHGGFEHGVALPEQRQDVLAATTSGTKYLDRKYGGRYWPELYRGERPIVFGHHVVGDTARVWNERAFGIDTGACHGGFLTALVVPGFSLHQVPAQRDHWRAAQSRWRVPVLRARPWDEYRWSKIDRELHALAGSKSADVRAFEGELRAWLSGLKDLLPALVERADARRDELREGLDERAFKKHVAGDPHAGLLFASQAGSLSPDACRTVLPTPGHVVRAARAFGLEPPSLAGGAD